MNGRIDYSNLQNITKQLKSSITKKYETFEKITAEVSSSAGSSGGSGGGGGGLGDLGDLMNIFFSQGTYNGTLKINGGLIVDYIETDDTGEAGDIDKTAVNKLIDRAIRSNNKRLAGVGGPGAAGSVGSLSGVGISSASIRNSFFSGGTIDGATVENLDGLNNLFKDDYLDMYSIASVRDNFIIYVSSAYNDVRFTYDDKERDYYTLSFGQQKDIFTNQDFVLSNQNIANTYINSKVYNVLFEPGNLPIGITGLTQSIEEQRAKFKISDMNVEIGKSSDTTASPIMTVNGDLRVMSGGRIFLDTREIKPTGGSGAIFSIPVDGITREGVITKINVDEGGSGYDPGSANIIFGAPRFATRDVFSSEGNQGGMIGHFPAEPDDSLTIEITDGVITSVNITGSNTTVYPGPPTVTISGNGSGAVITADMSANRWQSPEQALITGFTIQNGGSGYNTGTTKITVTGSPEVITAELEQGSLVVVNGVITSVQLPENGIGSFYMRGTNTIIMNTTDTASSQTLTDLFSESISLTNDSLTDLQIKYISDTVNQTTLSSIPSNNKTLYDALNIKGGMIVASNVVIIQNISFKIRTEDNILTHIAPTDVDDSLVLSKYSIPETRRVTLKNWFDKFKVFQSTANGNIETQLQKISLTSITATTSLPPHPTIGSAADGDAIGTFQGLIELDIVVAEQVTEFQKNHGYPSQLVSGTTISGNESTGNPIFIGENDADNDVNLKLPVDKDSENPIPLHFFGTYQLHNNATGSLEFITDGSTDIISRNNTFFSGNTNKIIMGYNSADAPTLSNNELLHVNGIIKADSIENTAIGLNTASSGRFSTLTVNGASTIHGDLTVHGTQTTINSTTLTVDDINIEMGSVNTPTDVTAEGGGIILKGTTDKSILWSSANFTSSENFNLASSKVFKISTNDVLSSTTLGTGVTISSLEQVAVLNSGSISTGFGNIDNGESNITTGGLLKIDVDADTDDTSADSAKGRISLGLAQDLNIYHGGTNSYLVNNTGNLILHTSEDLSGFIFDSKGGSVVIKENGVTMTTINNSGINIVTGDEYKINGSSVLSNNTLGTGVVNSSLTKVSALDIGSITSGFGNIDNGDSNITTGGVLHIDQDVDDNDSSADSLQGRITLGINEDLNIYHGGTDSFIVNKVGHLELHTQEASKGFIFDAKNGTLEVKEDGTLMTTINNTGINIVSGDEYQIDSNSVLSANTLGTGVVTSSLTTVAALDAGSISSNFGDIDNGDSNITTGGVLHIDKDADANDSTADSTTGMISLGIDSDLNLYHGGTDSFIVNKIGNVELHTQEENKGFIFDAKNGTIEIKEDGTLMTTINNTGINIVSGDEYQIDGNSVLSANTLGTGIVTSSLTTVSALDAGSISSNFGDIDNGDSNITTGGVLHIDKDADENDTTADSTTGMISLGIDSDLNLYHGGTDSFIVNKIGNLELHTQEAEKGLILDAKNGTVEIKEDGTLVTTINNTGINIVSGDEYQIDGNSVLSADTLGTGVVTSSLTTVAALDSGSITSNFGDIDIGTNTLKSQDILVTNAGIGVTTASAALDVQDIFTDKSNVNTIVKITSTTDDNTAEIGFGGRISLNGENGADPTNGGSIQEAVTIDYYLKERDQDDSDSTVTDTTADIWGLNIRIKDDEQMVDALTIVGAGGGPDGDNSVAHGANIGIGITNPTNKLDVDGTLRATGATSLISTLSVTGATNLASTLSVTGATNLASTLDITGATTINSTLSISGKYHGDGSKLTDLNTNLIKNDNSSIDVLTKTSGDPTSFDGVTTNTVYDERTSSGDIVSYSFRFKMTDATQTAYLFSSPTGTGGDKSNNRFVKIYDSGASIILSDSNETTDGSGNVNTDGTQYFQDDTLHHIVISAQTPFSGPSTTDYKIYVDGVHKFTQSEDANLDSPFTDFQTKFKLGIGHFGSDGHLDGEIQELYIFNSTITDSEATSLYNNILPFSLNNSLVHSLATTSSEFIKFKNESSETMRITNNKVGIGTNNPSFKLDVSGTAHITGTLKVTKTDFSYNVLQGHLQVGDNLNNAHFRLGSITSSSGTFSPLALLRSSDANNPSLIINYGSQFPSGTKIDSDLRVTGDTIQVGNLILQNSKLGIGTTSPTEKLEVNGNIKATTVEANLTGNVTGNITGNLTGNVTGDLTGDVTGDVTGDLTGNVTGNVVGDITGDVTGDVIGNLTGDVNGSLTGDVNGNVTGDLTGNVTGDVTGNLTGDVTGNVTGDVSGNVTGDLTGDVIGDVNGNLTGDVVGDITGNLTGDVNGNLIGDVTGNLTGDVTGNLTGDVTGDVTGNLTGDVTGNLTGDVTGNVTGDLIGDVTGDVTGNLTGDVTGNVTGDLIGDVTGDVTGNVTGNLIGNITGDVTGDLTGDVTGDLTGDVTGDLTGDVTGNLTGNVTGNLTGDVTGNLIGDVIGDITGNVVGNLTGDVTGNVLGNLTGDVTGNVVGDLTGDVTGSVTGNLTGDVTGNIVGDLTGDVTGNIVGNLTGDVTGNVTGNVVGDLTGDVTGSVTGTLRGDVEDGEWKGKAISSTKLAVSEAIKTLSVIELMDEPGSEINEDSDEALGTNTTTTAADKSWREKTHNNLKKAERNVESLRNTVESLVLAMNQMIKAFE